MREIEFRGMVENGEFVYGFLTVGYDSLYIKQRHYCPPTMQDPGGEVIHTRDMVIDLKTIGQYTGLKDKNDVKIFEGDIVKGTVSSDFINVKNIDFIGEVKWDDEDTGFFYLSNKDSFPHIKPYFAVDIVVIGNIYKNLKLLDN